MWLLKYLQDKEALQLLTGGKMNTQNASRDGSRASLFADVDEVDPPFASQTCHASPALEKGDGSSCTGMSVFVHRKSHVYR